MSDKSVTPINYVESTQPEIIRQNQIDEENQYLLKSKLIDALDFFMPWLINYRFLSKYSDFIKMIGSLLYFGLTTLSAEQTLGEEYTNLAQLNINSNDMNDHNLPKISKSRRLCLVFLQTIFPFISDKIIRNLYNKIKSSSPNVKSQKLWDSFLKNLPDYDSFIGNIFKLHLSIFFIEGLYFQISKRFTSIRYIFTKKPQEHNIEYRRIGILMLIQIIIEICKFFYKTYKYNRRVTTKNNKKEGKNDSDQPQEIENVSDDLTNDQNKCFICYEKRKFPSITPCGHVFCWDCIIKNCMIKEECPVCKKACRANKVIQLRNYI